MSQEQALFALAIFIKPFAALAVAFLTAVLVRKPLEREMKDGKLKRFLLKKIS